MPSVDPIEILFVLAIALFILRPQRLSDVGHSLLERVPWAGAAPGRAHPPDADSGP